MEAAPRPGDRQQEPKAAGVEEDREQEDGDHHRPALGEEPFQRLHTDTALSFSFAIETAVTNSRAKRSSAERFFWMRWERNPCRVRVGMATLRPSSVARRT